MEVILNVYINYIHAITAITVRQSRRMTILSAALTQMNSLKKKKKTSPQILKGNFLLKRDWLLAPGHGAPNPVPAGLRAQRPADPVPAGLTAQRSAAASLTSVCRRAGASELSLILRTLS